MNQIPAARWLGLTATPYRRDGLEELIFHQLGTNTHEFTKALPGQLPDAVEQVPAPALELRLHETAYDYAGEAVAGDPGGLHEIYRDLMADPGRLAQVVDDVGQAPGIRHEVPVDLMQPAGVGNRGARIVVGGSVGRGQGGRRGLLGGIGHWPGGPW